MIPTQTRRLSSALTKISLLIIAVVVLSPTGACAETRVILLGGQSNMRGYGDNNELSPPYDSPQTDVNFWDRDVNDWVPLQPGYANNIGANTDFFGPELYFGRAIKDAYPSDELYLIKHALSGTNLHQQWAPGGQAYTAFSSTVAAALSVLDAGNIDYEVSGMLWLQGESDAIDGQGVAYEQNLRNFIATIRSDYGEPDMPFIVGRIIPGWGSVAQNSLVRAAQVGVAETTDNVEWIDTDGYPPLSETNIHYGTEGIIGIGLEYADAYQVIVPEPISLNMCGVCGLLTLLRRPLGLRRRTYPDVLLDAPGATRRGE